MNKELPLFENGPATPRAPITGRGAGRIFKRGGSWWFAHSVDGEEIRHSVGKWLGKSPRACTEAEAYEALRISRDGRSLKKFTAKKFTAKKMRDIRAAFKVSAVSPVLIAGDDLRAMAGPIVYAYFRAGVAIYVGMSRYGLSRPFSAHHHALSKGHETEALREADQLAVWPCKTVDDAEDLEARAIVALHPTLNSATAPNLARRIADMRRRGALADLEPTWSE